MVNVRPDVRLQHRYTIPNVMVIGLLLTVGGLSFTAYSDNLSSRRPPSASLDEAARWLPIAVNFVLLGQFYLAGYAKTPRTYYTAALMSIPATLCSAYTLNLALNLAGLPSRPSIIPGALDAGVNCGDATIGLTDAACSLPLLMVIGAGLVLMASMLNAYGSFKTAKYVRSILGTAEDRFDHIPGLYAGNAAQGSGTSAGFIDTRQQQRPPSISAPPGYDPYGAPQAQRLSVNGRTVIAVQRPVSSQYASPPVGGRPLSNQFAPGSHPMYGMAAGDPGMRRPSDPTLDYATQPVPTFKQSF